MSESRAEGDAITEPTGDGFSDGKEVTSSVKFDDNSSDPTPVAGVQKKESLVQHGGGLTQDTTSFKVQELDGTENNSLEAEFARGQLQDKLTVEATPRNPEERFKREQTGQGSQSGSVSFSDMDSERSSGKKSSLHSVTGRRRSSRKKHSVLKEIIGSIEKKKGPHLPDNLGFGSSEERKALKVESLKERRKSSVSTPRESEETVKPLDRKKTSVQGLGFGSTERRKSLFDKVDPSKEKEKRKSVLNPKDAMRDKEGRSSEIKEAELYVDSISTSSLQQSAITVLVMKDSPAKADGVSQDDTASRLVEQKELHQPGTSEPHQNDTSKQQQEVKCDQTDGTLESCRSASCESAESDWDSEGSDSQKLVSAAGGTAEAHRDFFALRKRFPSNCGRDGAWRASIDSIPLDDNEGLTSTLLAGKIDEPLRNELENWLTSAIHRVDNNLSHGSVDNVTRQITTSQPKQGSRVQVSKTPRNTVVPQLDSSSLSSTSISERSSVSSLKERRPSATTFAIRAGYLSDENKLMPTDQLFQSTDLSNIGKVSGKGRTINKDQMSATYLGNSTDQLHSQETPEEGLRRLQREVEFRTLVQSYTKVSPRSSKLPFNLRKRKKPGENADYLHRKYGWEPGRENLLTKDLLCYYGGCEDPEQLKMVRLSDLNITGVDRMALRLFKKLQHVDLSENQVKMHDLSVITTLRKLSLMNNQLCDLVSMSGHFNHLQALDLSYNALGGSAIVHLANLPALETLNLDHNNITEIPEGSGGVPPFIALRIFSAAYNSLKTPSLLPMSKLLRLEKLLLAHNTISGIPGKMEDESPFFPRLELFDLTNNTVENSCNLRPLLECRNVKKVLLWETPLARKLACDGANRILASATPVLMDMLRAEQAGHKWITQQPPAPSIREMEAKMHVITQYQQPKNKLFDDGAEQEMAFFFKEASEVIIEEAGVKHCPLHEGYTSAILPFMEGLQTPVMTISPTKPADDLNSAPSVASSDIPSSMEEAMENVQISKNLTDNHLTDANAAVICLQNALAVPCREVTFSPRHYLTMTKSGTIRVNQLRLDNQPTISPRKDAVHLAQRFLLQAEVEARAQVHNVLERMKLHLENMANTLKQTLVQPPPFSPPRRMSEVNTEYTDSEGMLTFR